MRTRLRNSYPIVGPQVTARRKMPRSSSSTLFDMLPDDIVLCILVKLASAADSPADFVAAILTSKRFNGLGLDSLVLSQASAEAFAVKARSWSPSAKRFLQRCSDAGNVEASYTLGMIQFYCFYEWRRGAALMAKAAIRSHAPALYSLAIIQFNGSGSSKNVKDLIGGVTLCARAAFLGYVDALRELGHCLIDGYGIGKNAGEGHKFLLVANAQELSAICQTPSPALVPCRPISSSAASGSSPLISEFGFSPPSPKSHPSNRFLVDWYANQPLVKAYRICSFGGCGRPETRVH